MNDKKYQSQNMKFRNKQSFKNDNIHKQIQSSDLKNKNQETEIIFKKQSKNIFLFKRKFFLRSL